MNDDAATIAPELSAAKTAASVVAYITDRDSEGVLRQALIDIGVQDAHFSKGDVTDAIADLSKRESPRLLIVDISGVDEPVQRINALAEVCEPKTGVLAVGDRNDIVLYREVKAIGVFEYFFKPLSRMQLSHACNTVLTGTIEERSLRAGRLIITLGVRGGAGATTVGARLAWHLAQQVKRRVAFLDLDLRTGDAALQMDVTPQHALSEALEHPERIDELFLERGIIRVTERLGLLAAEELLDYNANFSEDAVLVLLSKLLRGYHYVFVDMPRCQAGMLQRVLHLPNLCLLVSDGSLSSARDVARWRSFIGPNNAERQTLHVLNKADGLGGLPMEEFIRASGQAPDLIVPFDRDVAKLSNLGMRRLETCQDFLKALAPALQDIAGETVQNNRTILQRIFS